MPLSRKQRLLLMSAILLVPLPCVGSKYIYLLFFRRSAKDEKARVLLDAKAVSDDPGDILSTAIRLNLLFNNVRARLLYTRAEERFRQQNDEQGEAYARIGRIASGSTYESVQKASAELAQEVTLPVVRGDPRLELWAFASKGYVDMNVSPALAADDWKEVHIIARRLKDREWEARANGEIGITAFLQGDLRQAEMMSGDSWLSSLALGDVGNQIRQLSAIGCALNQSSRYWEALTFLNRAINLASSIPEAGFPSLAYSCKAQALLGQGRLSETEQILNLNLNWTLANGMEAQASEILCNLGNIAFKKKDYPKAEKWLQRSIELANRHGLDRVVAQAMAQLVEIYEYKGDFATAESVAAATVDINRRSGGTYLLPRVLTILAEIKAHGGKASAAEVLYRNAEDVFEGMLSHLRESVSIGGLGNADMDKTYREHFQLEVSMGNTEEAFHVIERIRGRGAIELLQNGTVSRQNEPAKTNAAESAVSDMQLRLMRSQDEKERAQLIDGLFDLERRLEWAEAEDSSLSRQWFDKPASLRSVQATLKTDETVLEYVLDEPSAFCLWVSKSDAGIETLSESGTRIEESIRSYLGEIREERSDVGLGQKLYAILIAPVMRHLSGKRLIIVPDGESHFLPFEILRDSSGRFLVDNWIISYVPASTVIQILRTGKAPQPKKQFLGLGDVRYENQIGAGKYLARPPGLRQVIFRQISDVFHTKLYDLPETREEVLDLSRMFGTEAVVLLGAEATESSFKSEPLDEFRLIHLAVHGFSDPEIPQRSGLILGVDPRSQDDGLLQIREIMRLHFNADLVTLSACNTATGRLQGEEGIADLAEAFLVRGARAVVATRWSAADSHTHHLMSVFYRRIADGEDLGTALQQAKVGFHKESGIEDDAFYWAPFVLIGDGANSIKER